jgi:hypothetical protein
MGVGEKSATAARARHVVGTGAAVASTPMDIFMVVDNVVTLTRGVDRSRTR